MRGALTAHLLLGACLKRIAVHGRDSLIFEEVHSSRKIFCLMEQSMIPKRENIVFSCCREKLAQLGGEEPGSSTALQREPGDF